MPGTKTVLELKCLKEGNNFGSLNFSPINFTEVYITRILIFDDGVSIIISQEEGNRIYCCIDQFSQYLEKIPEIR